MEPEFPELKDITPPTPPPFSSPEDVQALVWQIFTGVAGLLLLVLIGVWWFWRIRRRKSPPLPMLPWEQLKHQLLSLRNDSATRDNAETGQLVGDAIRGYLQREHGLMARYRTTEELFGTTQGARRIGAPPPLPWLKPFQNVFTQADALKFAGTGGSASERESLVDAALSAVEDIRKQEEERRHAAAQSPLPPTELPPSPKEPTIAPLPSASPENPLHIQADTPPPAIVRPAPPTEPHPALLSPPPAFIPFTPPSSRTADSYTHPQTAAFARGSDIIPV